MNSLRVLPLCLLWLLVAAPCTAQVLPFQRAAATGPPFQGRRQLQGTSFYGRALIYGGLQTTASVALGDLWVSSDDGTTWTNVPTPGLPARFDGALVTVQTVVNNTQLLLFIGGSDINNVYNDVYFSLNGVNFVQSAPANFSKRAAFATAIALPRADQSGNAALNGLPALFVLGGRNAANVVLNDVYYSSGRGVFNYVLATSAAQWPARQFFQAVPVESGTRLVIAGGTGSPGVYFNDVWISDVGGFKWRLLLSKAQWAARAAFGLVNIAEKLFLFSGAVLESSSSFGDLYSSLDYGRSWTQVAVNTSLSSGGGRFGFGVAVNGKNVVITDGSSYSGNAPGDDAGRVLTAVLN